MGISAKAAWEIGKRYQEGGLERAIYDAPRPGQKPLLDAEHGQRIIAMVCGSRHRPGALDGAADRPGGGEAQVGRTCGPEDGGHPRPSWLHILRHPFHDIG